MQINVSSMEQLKERASYFVVRTKDSNTLHVPTLEQIMLMNNHIIEEFSWVTAPLHSYENSHVIKATVNDYQNRGEMEQDIYGIMPNYFSTTLTEFSTEFHGYENWD
jgi:hypothetical protein